MKIVPVLGVDWGRSPEDVKYLRDIYETVKSEYPDYLKKNFEYNEATTLYIPMYDTLPSRDYIEQMVRECNLSTRRYEETYYTKKEENEAQAFCLWAPYVLETEGTNTLSYGTKYKDNCPKCKLGGELEGDVLIERRFLKKHGIANLHNEMVVSKEIKQLIEANGLTGVSFTHRVKDYKGREMPEYYCMSVKNVLPDVNSRTLLEYDPPVQKCQACGITVPYILSNLYYSKEDLVDIKDFNLTKEYFNNASERYVIVSKKVKELFKQYGVRAWFNMLNVL